MFGYDLKPIDKQTCFLPHRKKIYNMEDENYLEALAVKLLEQETSPEVHQTADS